MHDTSPDKYFLWLIMTVTYSRAQPETTSTHGDNACPALPFQSQWYIHELALEKPKRVVHSTCPQQWYEGVGARLTPHKFPYLPVGRRSLEESSS